MQQHGETPSLDQPSLLRQLRMTEGKVASLTAELHRLSLPNDDNTDTVLTLTTAQTTQIRY